LPGILSDMISAQAVYALRCGSHGYIHPCLILDHIHHLVDVLDQVRLHKYNNKHLLDAGNICFRHMFVLGSIWWWKVLIEKVFFFKPELSCSCSISIGELDFSYFSLNKLFSVKWKNQTCNRKWHVCTTCLPHSFEREWYMYATAQ